jgi:hypothetical protein
MKDARGHGSNAGMHGVHSTGIDNLQGKLFAPGNHIVMNYHGQDPTKHAPTYELVTPRRIR